jgi:hypothetical protein
VAITPDELAASYTPGEDHQSDIEELADLAAEYGYRLVAVDAPESSAGVIPAANPATPEDMVRRLTWLKAAIKSAKAQIKAHEREEALLDAAVQEAWLAVGRTADTIDGYTASFRPRTSYSRKDGVSVDDMVPVLDEVGLGHIVKDTFSYQTLLAILTEMREKKVPIPEKLAELIEFKETFYIGIVPAGKARGGGRARTRVSA